MSLWREFLWKGLVRVRVVHRLPGRLRLHIPLLGHVPESWLPTIRLLEKILQVPEGITRVRMEPRTGNVLVEYDGGILNEAAILATVQAAMDWARRHHKRLAALAPEEVDEMIRRFKSALCDGIGDKLVETLKKDFSDVFCS